MPVSAHATGVPICGSPLAAGSFSHHTYSADNEEGERGGLFGHHAYAGVWGKNPQDGPPNLCACDCNCLHEWRNSLVGNDMLSTPSVDRAKRPLAALQFKSRAGKAVRIGGIHFCIKKDGADWGVWLHVQPRVSGHAVPCHCRGRAVSPLHRVSRPQFSLRSTARPPALVEDLIGGVRRSLLWIVASVHESRLC